MKAAVVTRVYRPVGEEPTFEVVKVLIVTRPSDSLVQITPDQLRSQLQKLADAFVEEASQSPLNNSRFVTYETAIIGVAVVSSTTVDFFLPKD